MADHILIKDLECFSNHGVLEAEKQLGQKFLVSIDMETDTRLAGMTDALERSINYAEVCQKVLRFMKSHCFDLIETVAERLAELLLLEYETLERVQIQIKKPWAPVMLPIDTVAVTIERAWHTVFLGVGSNLGEKEQHIEAAISYFAKHPKCKLLAKSSLVKTKPYGVKEQEDFVNGAFGIKTLLSPEEVLEVIGEIEQQENRVREIHWGPRTIDVDILFYDDILMYTEELHIPHPEIVKRDFVLAPMCEIAPYHMHPLYHTSLLELWERLRRSGEYEETISN